MGIRSIAQAWCVSMPVTQQLLLLTLADMSDDAGVCWPSLKTLADKCQRSTRTVQRASRKLEGRALVTVIPGPAANGRTRSNAYVLRLEAEG